MPMVIRDYDQTMLYVAELEMDSQSKGKIVKSIQNTNDFYNKMYSMQGSGNRVDKILVFNKQKEINVRYAIEVIG